MANTSSEKFLMYLNLLSIVGVIILLIWLPSVGLMAGLRFLLYIGSIALTVLNIGFYVAPQAYKIAYLKKRLLFVYIPSLVIVIFAVVDLITIIVYLDVFKVLQILFIVVNPVQAVTFSMLVAKMAATSTPLLG